MMMFEKNVALVSNVSYKNLKSKNYNSGFLLLNESSLFVKNSEISEMISKQNIFYLKYYSLLFLSETKCRNLTLKIS